MLAGANPKFERHGYSMRKLLLLVALLVSGHPACSAPIGAIVRGYDYDSAKRVTIIHLVNTSQKEISALSFGLQTTSADGTVSPPGGNEFSLDFVNGIAQGKGGFAAGATFDQETAQPGPLKATIDLVAYADGTADVLNQRAFESLIAGRKARVSALRKINELVTKALADPNEKQPSRTVLAQLQSLLAANRRHPIDGSTAYGGELQNAIQNLTNLTRSPHLLEPAFESNQLLQLVKSQEGWAAGILPHTDLVKAVQP
jgi:hypothetical protein